LSYFKHTGIAAQGEDRMPVLTSEGSGGQSLDEVKTNPRTLWHQFTKFGAPAV